MRVERAFPNRVVITRLQNKLIALDSAPVCCGNGRDRRRGGRAPSRGFYNGATRHPADRPKKKPIDKSIEAKAHFDCALMKIVKAKKKSTARG